MSDERAARMVEAAKGAGYHVELNNYYGALFFILTAEGPDGELLSAGYLPAVVQRSPTHGVIHLNKLSDIDIVDTDIVKGSGR